MIEFRQFIGERADLQARTWLVLGKGPSFDPRRDIESGAGVTIGINHVCDCRDVDFLHVMDIDVVEQLGDRIAARARYLVLPRFPHVAYRLPGLRGTFHRAGAESVEQLLARVDVLRSLADQGRLLVYDASTAREPEPGAVQAGPFSAATVIELLGASGVRRIRTLGVDGGTQYAGAFAALDGVTRLDAGQESFDLQFAAIARSIRRWSLDCGPLDMQVPVQVFVGSQVEQGLASRVLEHSIRRHSSVSVEVTDLHDAIRQRMPQYGEIVAGLGQGTPFSLQRFAIPELTGRKGRAIYVDSDMQVFTDIRELWGWPIGGGCAAAAAQGTPSGDRAPQLSVLVIDCERAGWDLRSIAARLRAHPEWYPMLLAGDGLEPGIDRSVPYRWNSLELFEAERTSLLHYTNMRGQPWLAWDNPLARIWCEELLDAVDAGAVDRAMVADHVARGWVRPSLLLQLDQRIDDPLLLPMRVLRQEVAAFLPPHMQPRAHWLRRAAGYGSDRAGLAQLLVRRMLATAREQLRRVGAISVARKVGSRVVKIRRALRAGRSRA